ncbi:hypothetical protein [Sulfurivermis fontis]|uniref:hypothetical protein n=1 Tax=Sulfurivermis fontis TaxID=1972068 RepID=UPI000FDB3685|nr:hypothetical protein [Sulfurivermis fontis]
MDHPVIVIGTGEMAGVFSRGLLRQGHPLVPVTRQMDMAQVAAAVPQPLLVLVTVGEDDLQPVLAKLPTAWRDRLGLLQNELLPRDWQPHGIDDPTVIAVWFEKKKGQDYKVLVPSPVYGPAAPIIERALESLDIPVWELGSSEELTFELVRKNVYILTTNIAGLALPAGTDVDALWNQHQALAREVADEVMDIQFRLIGAELPRDRLITGMVEGIEGDLRHKCMGRSAPARLARALQHADQFGLAVPKLREIAKLRKV